MGNNELLMVMDDTANVGKKRCHSKTNMKKKPMMKCLQNIKENSVYKALCI